MVTDNGIIIYPKVDHLKTNELPLSVPTIISSINLQGNFQFMTYKTLLYVFAQVCQELES